jgi:hypothetical protein
LAFPAFPSLIEVEKYDIFFQRSQIMVRFPWLNWLSFAPWSAERHPRRPTRQHSRLLLEFLEERTLLSAYTFTQIADMSPGPLSVTGPAINNRGAVAFTVDRIGPQDQSIFTGAGGPLTTIAVAGDAAFGLERPSINDGGTVSFEATFTAGALNPTVFTGNGGPLSTIAGPDFASFVGIYTSLNNNGTVAFYAVPNTGTSGIFTGSGGPITTIADVGALFQGFPDADPAINNGGMVAFYADLQTGGSGIFVDSGGSVTTIADTSGPFLGFLTHPSINDAGAVAFRGTLRTGGEGLFIGDGTSIVTVADTSGPFRTFLSPSLNQAGEVAFYGLLNTGQEGIFTGPDPQADKVIATGDPLLGATAEHIYIANPKSLNDAGQVAFVATLSDGRILVVRADPTTAPSVASSVDHTLLWPPNHRLVNVGLSVEVQPPDAALQVQVYANDHAASSDAANIGPGTLELRATRQGDGSGRVYLIVSTVTNSAGSAFDVRSVVVPHDNSPHSIALVRAEAAFAEDWYRMFQTAPPGFHLLGTGPACAAANNSPTATVSVVGLWQLASTSQGLPTAQVSTAAPSPVPVSLTVQPDQPTFAQTVPAFLPLLEARHATDDVFVAWDSVPDELVVLRWK